jgi:hypothetical protein
MKYIVAGSRGFTDYNKAVDYLSVLVRCPLAPDSEPPTIISGTAKGADQLGEEYAKNYGFEVIRMPANWEKHGRSAGYKRNVEMAKIADHCIVFWDGESRGSKHMIDIAMEAKLTTTVVFV